MTDATEALWAMICADETMLLRMQTWAQDSEDVEFVENAFWDSYPQATHFAAAADWREIYLRLANQES